MDFLAYYLGYYIKDICTNVDQNLIADQS